LGGCQHGMLQVESGTRVEGLRSLILCMEKHCLPAC
jgi:hypothetical protein